MHGQQNIKKEL